MLDAPEGSAARGAAGPAATATATLRPNLRPVQNPVDDRPYQVLEGGGERTILVAEDDHSCRSALHHYFERSGYRVTEAADGPTSLRAVFQHSADLVIL